MKGDAGEFAVRRRRIVDELSAQRADVFLITALTNVRYLSGFTGSNAALVVAPGWATLITDPRYTTQARNESDCRVQIAKGSLVKAFAQVLARKKWKRIAIERNRISFATYSELHEQAGRGTTLLPVGGVVERLRMVKSFGEIARIRESVLTNSRAYEEVLSQLTLPASETDLAAEFEWRMRKLGAEKPAFETIVASGTHSALPHAAPRAQRIGPNRLLLVDMGAFRDGYASDMTRTSYLGKPSFKAKKLYAAVLEAQLAAIDSVRPGVTAATVDRVARQVLKKHGLDKMFVHSTGHGLGLEIHEAPRLGKQDETPLGAGMVITVEPGAYEPGFGGVRIEDTIVVTETGSEVLTPTPKNFVTL